MPAPLPPRNQKEMMEQLEKECIAAYERWELMKKIGAPDKEDFFRDFRLAWARAEGAWAVLNLEA